MPDLQAVLFDWGDTVLREFPEYRGAMADWPRVEAMPGARAALQALQPRFRLALATNAVESGENQVRAALSRAGLDGFFQAVFTARELGLAKPDPAFYALILEKLGLDAGQAVMVGDSYSGDVAGAKEAGLRAIWYNPSGELSPSDHPLHDAEVQRLEDLPAALESPFLPDVDMCLALLRSQGAPPILLGHCRTAAAIAYRLGVWLRQAGEAVDPLLAHRGGLLHDLDKITSRQPGRVHGEWSAYLLREIGQPLLAEIARRHTLAALMDVALAPRTWEEKLACYADKLVEGESLATLDARLQGILGRYPQDEALIRESWPKVAELQTEICSRLGLSPEALHERLGETGATSQS